MSIARKKFYTFVNSALLTVSLISIQSLCYAGEYVKNGMPCVKEICIGDGVDELTKVNWDKVNVKPNPKAFMYTLYIKNRDKELQTYIGKTKNLANYLGMHKFDSSTIGHLNEVTAVCDTPTLGGLTGTYKSKDGNLTEVEIELIPDQQNFDSLTQSWVVTEIARTFKIASPQQREEVTEEMNTRYSFVDKNIFDDKGYTKKYASEASFGKSIVNNNNLNLRLVKDNHEKNRASIHPGCPGATEIKMD